MSNYGPPIELKFDDHVIAIRSARVKLDGIIVDMAASDLARIKKEGNGKITGAQLTLRFMPAADRRSVEGTVFAVKPRTAARLSLHRFEVSLAFQSLGKHDLLKLKRFVADLR